MANTRFFKSIISILFCAVFALIYVHQETEIVKTGFLITKQSQKLSFLLDQYRSLVYNLSQLESPDKVENALCAKEIALCMPQVENIRRFDSINLAYNREKEKTSKSDSFWVKAFDRFSAKAEAKVVR